MINKKSIPIDELDELITLIQLEQTFRAKLHLYKELAEFRLKYAQELTPLAERLRDLKQLIRNRGFFKDKELDREIRNIINKKFAGGIIK